MLCRSKSGIGARHPRSGVFVFCLRKNTIHNAARRRERADGIGGVGVAGEEGGLATAAAKINFVLRAFTAELGHPFGAAETVEAFRTFPNPAEWVLAHVVETQAGNAGGRRAREDVADGIDGEVAAAPAVHA